MMDYRYLFIVYERRYKELKDKRQGDKKQC